MYLVDIYRADGTELHAVAPETVLQEGDSLWFCGSADAVASLRSLDGMEHQESDQSKKVVTAGGRSGLVQVVVAARSPLVGRTVRESSFRSCYNAAIIAVHRQVHIELNCLPCCMHMLRLELLADRFFAPC